jgi:hypothetical protein
MKDNPFSAKAKPAKKGNPFVKKTTQSGNGKPVKSNPWGKKKPKKKLTLAEMRKRNQAERQKSSKLDFVRNGIRFHNCRRLGAYWLIDVTNGDFTITFHNKWGSWMADGQGDNMIEPLANIAAALQDRWTAELKDRKIERKLPSY